MFPELYWYQPYALGMFVLPFIVFLLAYVQQKRRWQQVADAQFLPWLKKHAQVSPVPVSRLFMLAMAWLLFCVALAGPRTIKLLPPSLHQDASYVRVLIDFSQSMQAVDSVNNRIEQTTSQLGQWLSKLPGHLKTGLTLYAGHSHELLVPTGDHQLLQHFIKQLPRIRLPVKGNNLAAAVQLAGSNIKSDVDKNYLIIFSDGDMSKQALEKALASLETVRDKFRQIMVVGVGGDEAVTIPLQKNQVLSHEGKTIVSRRHPENLVELAQVLNGEYYAIEQLQSENKPLQHLLGIPGPLLSDKDRSKIQWHEWFFIPLLLGWLFLLIATLDFKAFFPGVKIKRIFSHFLFFSLLVTVTGCENNVFLGQRSSAIEQQVASALESENYRQVLKLSQAEPGADLTDYTRFAQGVACYRLKDYSCAQQVFSWLAWNAKEHQTKAQAIFNLANSYFYLGDYEQAQVLFQDALRQGITPRKVKINLEFSRSLARAIRQTIADIDKTQQRAQWRAATSKLTEKFTDRVADGIFLPGFKQLRNNPIFRQLSQQQQQHLLAQGIKFKLYNGTDSSQNENFWVLSKQDKKAQTTAQLYNQLMAYETGLHYVPEQPLESEGPHSW